MLDDKSDFNAIPLCNSNTFNEWCAAFIAFLYGKDLESYVNIDPTKLLDADKLKNSKHCYSYMFRTCTATTKASLPADCQPKFDVCALPQPALAASLQVVFLNCWLSPSGTLSSPVPHAGARRQGPCACAFWNDLDSFPDCLRWGNNFGLAARVGPHLRATSII